VKFFGTSDKVILIMIFGSAFISCIIAFLYLNHSYKSTNILVPLSTALYLDKNQPTEKRVEDLLSYMTLEEKIGQMTLVERNSLEEISDINSYSIGALLSGAGSNPIENTPVGWKNMISEYQEVVKQSRLGIPILYGVDAIHGHANVPTATVFPHAIGLGASNNAELVKAVSNATAEELFATGVNWSFSPNLDQPQDIRWGRVYEAFSDDPILVSNLGVAFLEGLQENNKTNNNEIFILASPKHYLGLGSMEWNSSVNKNYKIDQGYTKADEELLRSQYLPPFEKAIDAGALSIMIGLNTWGDKKMVLQKKLLTGVLKEELGFKGFLVSDWYGVHEGRNSRFFATVEAVNAGVDMVMLPFDYEVFIRHMKWANRLGVISDERINDAVKRILFAKFSLGLFDNERENISKVSIPNLEHKTLAREAVAQSLVLLKNQNNLLPLSTNTSHIRIAGSAANNTGMQMGAWTIEWQGVDGNWLEGTTSILEGIKNQSKFNN
jgi:beta-glucosidase